MTADFFASARFQMALPSGISGVAGGLIMPASISAHTLFRRPLDKTYPHLSRRLLDPQLYLGALPANSCRKACVNLSTYSWFKTSQTKYESAKQKQAEWNKRALGRINSVWQDPVPTALSDIDASIRSCISAQQQLACEALILPTPLTVDLSSDFSTELRWLDRGLIAARRLGPDAPVLASVAISDTALRPVDPWESPLLDIVIDQITARFFDGVYLVIELANETGYYCTHPNTVGSVLRIVDALKHARVVVGFAGVLGLLALAAGADTWSTGWYRGERRLRLVDFEDQRGMAYPTYYSHHLASEISLEADLDRVVAAGKLSALSDATPASELLLEALRAGKKAEKVADWAYLPSNVKAAQRHFLQAVIRETQKMARLDPANRRNYGQTWVDGADQLATELYRVGSFHQRTELNHQAAWKKAFHRYLRET